MELSRNKDLFQTVFDSASNGIAVMQSVYNDQGKVIDFSILLFNAYTLNWIGDIDYKGRHYSEVFPTVKETGILQRFIEVAETGVTANFESWYDGEGMQYWFRFTAVKQADLLVVTTEDITESKEAEIALKKALDAAEKQRRLYDSITNNTPDLVYVFDLDYKFTYANKALLTMWGKSAEDAIGKGLRENGYEEWHALMHEREIDEVVATKKSVRGTVSFPHAELGSRVYDYILVPVLNEQGEVEVVAGTTRDITEAKFAETKLQQSELRLKSMIDQTPAPTLVLMGENLIIEQINKPMLQLIGFGEEVVGQPLLELMPELADQFIWKQVEKVYKEGVNFDQKEVEVAHKREGELQNYYYNIAYRPFKEGARIAGMIQVAIDVTEQVNARKKLEESDSRFRALVNATSDVVYRMNADWTIMRNLEGRGFLSDTGEPILNWMDKYIHPLDRAAVTQAVEEAIANKSTFELVHRVVDAEGELGWTFSKAIPILNAEGNIFEWFGAASDVTERKKAESALRNSEENLSNLVLRSPVGICVMDAATLVSEIVNEKFVEIAGKPYEAIKGRHYWDAFAEVASYYESALQEVVDKGEPFYANEAELMLIRHGKEEIIYVTFVYEPMKDISGAVKKVVVWVLENTMQVQARRKVEESETRYRQLSQSLEEQISDRTRELQRSNEDLQQFAHVASHDLKEPIRKIKIFTGRLIDRLEGKLDESSEQFVEKIHSATDRMFTMIDGVLAYSTINAGKQMPEPVNLNEVIKSIQTDLEVTLQKKDGTIRYDALPVVEGAPVLLYQLFYNLINNSIKFAKADVSPQITITSEVTVVAGKSVACIRLTDNGIGFDADQADRIFETFTRLNSKDKYEGTGLGLSLCKKIVERHGGSIAANSSPGMGTTFTIKLPLLQKDKVI